MLSAWNRPARRSTRLAAATNGASRSKPCRVLYTARRALLRRSAPVAWLIAVFCILAVMPASAADWPMWRCDVGRTACSPEKLAEPLHLQWVRQYEPLRPAFWQVRQERVQFDAGYEPVVCGQTMFVCSSRNDSVTALETETGRQRWRFYAQGPLRFAPAVWDGKVFCASDDGCLYCLDAATGAVRWRHRAAPAQRHVLGNGRLISVWPVRGGPVVAGGRVYLAAGVWPFEGIFVWALDAQTGRPVWVNDRCGSLYLEHPHGAMAFGGPSPQGSLLIRGGELVVPSSRAFPALFDLETGKLADFAFGHGGHGSRPGGWFVATDPAGELVVDPQINTEIHDAGQQIIGQAGVRPQAGEVRADQVTIGNQTYRLQEHAAAMILVGGKTLRFADGFPGVEGDVHTMLAADGKLFVVTRQGSIYCFGDRPTEATTHPSATSPLQRPDDRWGEAATAIIRRTGAEAGYALVLGMGTGRLAEELALQSALHVIAVEPDAEKADAFRRRLDQAGLYGERIAVQVADPLQFSLPPYLASLIVSEDLHAAGFDKAAPAFLQTTFAALRPYGGTLCLELPADGHAAVEQATRAAEASMAGARIEREGDLSLVVRAGPLPGAADYCGQPNRDQLVRAPLGLLWFGDTFHHHKLFYKTFTHEAGRGLPETIEVAGGVMKYQVTAQPYGPNPSGMGYHEYLRWLERELTYRDGYTDVYTGRVLSESEATRAIVDFARPPDGEPEALPAPIRTNPLTGLAEGREMIKTYGCDLTPVDYGELYTLRSGTAAYYDKGLESGTISIGGTRSGCRNSIIPAGGVLSLPSWTGNCTCNYPVHTSLALVAMPPQFEQWSAWGDVAVEAPLGRVGINLGAPGDRVADDGTLWLDWPSVGGPSPMVPVQVQPEGAEAFYRHALWSEGGQGWPWVSGSGIKGLTSLRIEPVALKSTPPGNTFSVRWLGSVQPQHRETYTFYGESDHGLRLWVADQLLLDNSAQLRRGERGEVSASIALESGKPVPIKLEYDPPKERRADQPAKIALSWSSGSTPKSMIPPDRLVSAAGKPGGLTGLYYATATLAGPAALQTDPQLRFDWGHALPAVLQPLPRPVSLEPRSFTVRLTFAEPDALQPGQRVFSVRLQGRAVLEDFDIVREAGGDRRGIVKEFRGVKVHGALQLDFASATQNPAILCGVELILEKETF